MLDARAGAYHRVAPGEQLKGWRLVEIGESGALFEAADAESTLDDGEARRLLIDRDGARALDAAATQE